MSTPELKRIIGRAPKDGWQRKEHSFSVLWILMPDESKVYRYSYDWPGGFSGLRDQRLGIARLKSELSKPQYKGHEVAIIFDRETNAKLFESRQGIIQEVANGK